METMGGKKKKMKMCEASSLTDSSSGVDGSKIGYNNNSGKIGRTHHHSQGHESVSEGKQNQVTGPKNTVGTVMLFGVPIVSLVMDGKERLCLAQISSTLLKEFSYNEIHNRRVALGITCIQCTPVQLEILRRAGAMPVTSRRCGMITRREAERLCQSFLGDHAPPQLPENFAFEVYHECAWGCRGAFVPSRYNSSRAKCIRCTFCQLFFSPNKFIFHSHRLPDSRYVQPDAANFNSWRRHLKLCGDPPEDVEALNNLTASPGMMTAQIVHAWEDVKAMFNGGTRKRLLAAHSIPSPTHNQQRSNRSSSTPSSGGTPTGSGNGSGQSAGGGGHSHGNSGEKYHHSSPPMLVQTSSISSGSTSSTASSSSSGNPHQNNNNYPQVSSSSLSNPRPGSQQQSSSVPSFLSPHHMHNLHHNGSSEPILQSPPSVLHSPGACLPGSPPRLDSIWNPGLSAAAAAAAAVAASRSSALPPLPFHPLSIPWFRRPLFPFSHPFGPTCKLFGENGITAAGPAGTLSPGTEGLVREGVVRGGQNGSIAPHLPASMNTSAFKPVPGSRGAEQLFSWLNNNNNIVHSSGGIIYPPCIPEDLSLGSGTGDLHAHSLIEVKNPGIKLPSSIHHQFALDLNTTSAPDSSKENIHTNQGSVSEDHSHSNGGKGRSHSKKARVVHQDSEDEETVDIESTEGEADYGGNDPLAHWFQGSRGLKRPLDEDETSLGIKQEVCKFESNRGNGGGKKKRLWDCDRRVVKVKCSPGSGSRGDDGGRCPSPENLRFESNRCSPENNNDTNSGPSTPEILSLTD